MAELPPPPPFRPLQRRRAGAILYSLTALAGIIWFAALPTPATEGAPRSQLEEAVAGADRVVFQTSAEKVLQIEFNLSSYFHETLRFVYTTEKKLLEIKGQDEVADFVGLLDWRLTRPEEYKEQPGPINYQVVFFRGDKEVARLDCVAKYALRWVNGSWPGDVVLTPGSRYKLNAWFVQHSAPNLRPQTSDTASK